MSLFSKQIFYCVNCGKQVLEVIKWAWFPTCGQKCHEEFKLKEACSILGKPYEPKNKNL